MCLLQATKKKVSRFSSEGNARTIGFSVTVKHEKLSLRIGVPCSELESTLERIRQSLVALCFVSEIIEKVDGFGNGV